MRLWWRSLDGTRLPANSKKMRTQQGEGKDGGGGNVVMRKGLQDSFHFRPQRHSVMKVKKNQFKTQENFTRDAFAF